LIALAALVIALALLWWVGLAPALRTLRAAGEQRAALQAQASQMQEMARQAQALKDAPRMNQAEALRLLEAAMRQRLGASAKLSVAGERATVTLKDAPAASLAAWLADARANAHAKPLQARLTRGETGGPSATWSGALTLALPGP
jgi:general secretion pathway protein M